MCTQRESITDTWPLAVRKATNSRSNSLFETGPQRSSRIEASEYQDVGYTGILSIAS